MNQPDPNVILPHGDSFRFVDTFIDYLIADETIRCSKQFTGNETFFPSHFPGNPIIPGVIITEALAQVSGLLSYFIHNDDSKKGGYLLRIEKMTFLKSVAPPVLLEYTAKKLAYSMGILKTEVAAFNKTETIAKGRLVLSIHSEQ